MTASQSVLAKITDAREDTQRRARRRQDSRDRRSLRSDVAYLASTMKTRVLLSSIFFMADSVVSGYLRICGGEKGKGGMKERTCQSPVRGECLSTS